ncbi:MAG: radical SAM family heme chaperone HemW [Campylobacterota bacterium]|nr:radical SAM family heme chaperone HemW [Campylobacterota bacterium]
MLLYIHIPFCDSKCHYCSFNSYVDKFELKEAYMRALCEQFKYEIENFNITCNSIETLYIGGGTPSCIEPYMYKELLELIEPYLQKNIQKSIEANPNSATHSWLKQIRELGFNRISFGVQSFRDDKLKMLGRAHKSEDAIKAIKDAKELGFDDISLDIIYGTNMDTKTDIKSDLKEAFKLPINHISAYSLTLEEGTPFESKKSLSVEDLELTTLLFDEIEKRGFKQYEISNFGKVKSAHNMGYWEYNTYIGLGSGAVGFLHNKRFYPSKDIQSYIDKPYEREIELLSDEDIKIEKIFLGLRSCIGVDENILHVDELKRAKLLVEEKKLNYENGRFYNNDFLLSDEIALFL